MKFRTTLILAIILALGIAGVVMMQKRDAQKEEAKKSEGKILTYWGEKIKEIIIQPSGIHAVRDSAGWNIIEPVRTEGEKGTLDAVANMFEWAKMEKVVSSDPSEYASFGLQPPRAVLVVKSDETQDTLYVGDRSPVGSFVYARKGGSTDVFQTTTSLEYNTTKSLFDYRDKKILSFDKNQVNSVEIKNRKGRFVLNKNGAYWDLVAPVSMRADATKINSILDRSSYQSAQAFIEEQPQDLKKYGLHKPAVELSLTLGVHRSVKTLQIGDLHEGKYYARDTAKPPVFTVDSSYVNLLLVGLGDLRNKKLTDFSTADVDRVEITVGDSLYVCVKDTSNDWSLVAPKQGGTKSWKISSILTDASTLKAEAFADDTPTSLKSYGLEPPRVKINFYRQSQLLAQVLYGKNKDDKLVYCKTGDEKAVALVKKESFDKANIKLNDIYQPPPAKETTSN